MSNWKIIKVNYVDQDKLINKLTNYYISQSNNIGDVHLGDPLYFCYRKQWGLFWKLRRILNQYDYNRLCENTAADGHNVRELFRHVNF